MASQSEWFDKIKSFVPDWLLSETEYATKVIQSIAKGIAEAEASTRSQIDETFVDLASTKYLDTHGYERSIFRDPSETDAQFKERVKYIQNSVSPLSLKGLIQGSLNNGIATIVENWDYGFADEDIFPDDGLTIFLSGSKRYDYISVVIPKQTIPDDTAIKRMIVESIQKNKTLGVIVDIVFEAA